MERIKKLSTINTVINSFQFGFPFCFGIFNLIYAYIKNSNGNGGHNEQLSFMINLLLSVAFIIPSLVFIAPILTGVKASKKYSKINALGEKVVLAAYYKDSMCKLVISCIVAFIYGSGFINAFAYGFDIGAFILAFFPAVFLALNLWQFTDVKRAMKSIDITLYKDDDGVYLEETDDSN